MIVQRNSCWNLELNSHPNGSAFRRRLFPRATLISRPVLWGEIRPGCLCPSGDSSPPEWSFSFMQRTAPPMVALISKADNLQKDPDFPWCWLLFSARSLPLQFSLCQVQISAFPTSWCFNYALPAFTASLQLTSVCERDFSTDGKKISKERMDCIPHL